MAGVPKKPGDYGIRFGYVDENNPNDNLRQGIAHYAFMRVTSDGENKANILELPDATPNMPYEYNIDDNAVFSKIVYDITYY